MRADLPDPITDYLRFLMGEWERSGKTIKSLAAAAGVAKSLPSAIKLGTVNAGFYSVSKFAKVFGYFGYEDFVKAAYSWDRTGRTARPDVAGDGQSPATTLLAKMGIELGYSPEEVEIAALLTSFVSPTAEISKDVAVEMLDRARWFLRDGRRAAMAGTK